MMRSGVGVVLASVLLTSACTVHDTPPPALAGPSELALSLSMSATPDTVSQDGSSQSSIIVTARDPNGQPVANQSIRLDMFVNNQPADYGMLSVRNVVTGRDGRASATYTAPAPPPASATLPSCAAGAGSSVQPGGCVIIGATPVGSNFVTLSRETVQIHLLPVGMILPPAGTPSASFTYSPTSPTALTSVSFDGTASQPGTNSSSIQNYGWSFGDGGSGSGAAATHQYNTSGSFTVTLTVTNDRGLSASTSQTVSVSLSPAPTAAITFSPGSPTVASTIVFSGAKSTAAAGRTIVSYAWDFGDPSDRTPGSGLTSTHMYSAANTYSVTLVVTDDLGNIGTTVGSVTVK
jgi:PKD repeat protein